MPVTEQTPVVSQVGNSVTTVFAYNFKIGSAADIEVSVDGVVQTLTTHYSVSGVGVDGGGNVTFITAPTNGAVVVLRRKMAYKRTEFDYQENGDLLAETLDADVDAVVMMIQQISADLVRTMKLPVGTITDQTIVGAVAARVGKLMSFDASGNLMLAVPADFTLTTVSSYIATLLDDSTAAAARATLGFTKGSDIASANALILGTDGNYFDITGTTTITSIGALGVGTVVKLHFDAALTLTHHATDLILPGGANITTASGDEAEFVEYAVGDWRCTNYTKASGQSVIPGLEDGTWTDYSATSTFTGWSSFTLKSIYYKDIGKTRFVSFILQGTSNATTASFTLPSASSNTIQTNTYCRVIDNGVEGPTGLLNLPLNSSTVDCYRSALAAWTNSGTKLCAGQFTYQLP